MKRKLTVSIIISVLFLLALPIYVELFESPAGKEAWYFTMFLTINPILFGVLGIIAGTEIKRMWYFPIASALLFPPCFWLSDWCISSELYVYMVIYLPVAVGAMLVTWAIITLVKKHKNK